MDNGNYIEIAVGKLSNRNIIIKTSALINYIKENQELYRSYFSFDSEIKEHIESGKKSPAGYIGKFYLNQIVLDIDRGKETLGNTLERMKTTCNRLVKEFDLENNFQVWFSGRGFHIHIPDIFNFVPSNELPLIVKTTIDKYFPEADTRPINSKGLIRVGRTLNAKSNLYKIPIRESEIWFLTEDQVNEWAIDQRNMVIPIKYTTPKTIFNIIQPVIEKEEIILHTVKPNRRVTCMQHCFNAGAVEGTRHERILSMTSWLHREGIPQKGTISMMYDYAPKMDKYEIRKIVTDIYTKQGYSYGCQSKVMKQFCDPICIYYSKKNYLPEIFTSKDIEVQYRNQVNSPNSQGINLASFFGITHEKGYWLRPGHVMGIIAGTGKNKSTLMQNLVLMYKDYGDVLFINTEMSDEELFERFLQIEYRMTPEMVRKYYMMGNNNLSNCLAHVHYTKSVPDYDGVCQLVMSLKPKILVVDVIDDIKPGKDRSIQSQEDMYGGLKELTRKFHLITFMVHHTTKSSAFNEKGEEKNLTVHSSKGSSAFEQKCDVVIGIQGNITDKYRTIRSLKGRSTVPFEAQYEVDMQTFRYNLINN